MNVALRNRPPRIARKISIDDFIHELPDDERSSLCALLEIYPLGVADDIDLVDVVMVGFGDVFMSRARGYQERHAAALAEWTAWDSLGDDWARSTARSLRSLISSMTWAAANSSKARGSRLWK